jgi:hypothetical protein
MYTTIVLRTNLILTSYYTVSVYHQYCNDIQKSQITTLWKSSSETYKSIFLNYGKTPFYFSIFLFYCKLKV